MVTGMLLPSDKFSNIEVTNGKITEVNDSNVVFGITMPGLKDSLDMKFDNEKLDLDVPEYFEVTADVTDFELDMMMSMATSNFLSDLETDDLNIDNLRIRSMNYRMRLTAHRRYQPACRCNTAACRRKQGTGRRYTAVK